MISSEKLQERVELLRAGKLTNAPYAITLLEVAKKAHLNGQDNAPRLLLDAVDHRIREIDPDSDPWEAAQRMAKEKNNSGLRGGYWGIMMLDLTAADYAGFADGNGWQGRPGRLDGVFCLHR